MPISPGCRSSRRPEPRRIPLINPDKLFRQTEPALNIKPMPNRKNIPAFSSYLYRYRNLVERFFNKIKHYRAVATRYDKRADNFLAGVKLASIRIWMRANELMT